MRNNIACDSETVDGNIVCFCNSKGECLEHPTLDELLHFLTKQPTDNRIWLWNISFDFDGVFKKLPMENLAELFGDTNQTTYKEFRITYLGRNNVSISFSTNGHRRRVMAWDAAQWYDYHSLKDMAKQYASADSQKMESAVVAHFVSDNNTLEYYAEHAEEIKSYCIGDCRATKELAD